MASHQVPPSLHEKFTLLRYFAQYMDENLTEGGEGGRGKGGPRQAASSSIPQIKRWIRAPKAIIMHLTNGTIQVRRLISDIASSHQIVVNLGLIINVQIFAGKLLQRSYKADRGRRKAVRCNLH